VIEAEPAAGSAPPVLFLGEGPTSARYLEGVLQTAFNVTRVFGSEPFGGRTVDDYALFVLSDYPARQLTREEQELIVRRVERGGAGLLMIGGWASFGGPRGGYHGSRVAEILPVEVAPDDDRTNTPLGTILIARREPHPAIRTIQSQEPAVVVGFNRVAARPEATVLVHGYALQVQRERAQPHLTLAATLAGHGQGGRRGHLLRMPVRAGLERIPTPMLSVWEWGNGRVGAFAPDVSPHWAGGIIDWGARRVKLPTGAEIGHLYGAFLLDLCHWLCGRAGARA
jgi:uncharacterized membrane protein